MQKYHNVFISSTSEDLEAHRRAVIDILPQGDVHAINMEGFSASRNNALQVCYEELCKADIFIGIYAYRYGFAPGADMAYTDDKGNTRAGDGKTSITEWEYRWAAERGIPLLLYVVETDSWNPAHMDDDKTAIENFKKHIGGKHVRESFNKHPDSLAKLVSRDINKTLRDLMRPSPDLAKAQEDHAITVARTRQQAEARQLKPTSRYVGILPRYFRKQNTPFHDRLREQEDLRDAIANRERLITVYGRGGVGKTGLACYVIEGLERTSGAVDGMVYRSLQTGTVTISEIVADFGRIVPLEIAPGTSPAEQIAALLEALRDGHYALLLDNFETAQDDDTHAIDEPSLKLLIETVLERGGLTLIITTRYPFPIDDLTLEAHHTLIPLEEGLPLPESRDFMRSLKGAEHLPDDDDGLDRFIGRARGFPRALEAAMGWLNAGRGRRKLDDLLDDAVEIEKVTAHIVGRAVDALPVNLRQVLEALAICREPAPYDLLEYLLAPFRDQTAYPLRDALDRLIDAHFIVMSGERYGLHPLDREHCLNGLPEGDANDLPEPDPMAELAELMRQLGMDAPEPELPADAPFTRMTLNHRAIEYYRSKRKPGGEWRTLDDLQPQLMEFEHRIALGDYDTAAELLVSIDFDYLLLWGYAEMVRDYHLRLQGKITGKTLQGISEGLLGLAYSDLGDVPTAIEYYERALAISQDIGDKRDEGADLGNLGNAYSDLGDVPTAIEYYERALEIAQDIGDKRGEGIHTGNLGLAYGYLGDMQTAIPYHERALAIAQDIGDRSGEGNHTGNLGNAYSDLGDVPTAIEYYERGLAIAQDIGDKRGEGNRLGNLGVAYSDLGDVPTAISYYERALAIAQDIGDKRGEGNRLGNLGIAYSDLGDVPTAISYYERALKISQEIGDRSSEGYDFGSLGLAKAINGDVVGGIRNLETSVAILTETGRVQYLSYKLVSLTEAHMLNGDDDSALATIAGALAHDVPQNNHAAAALAGIVHLRRGSTDEAQTAFESAVAAADDLLAKTPGLYEALYARGLARAGLSLISGGALDEAMGDYRSALTICDAAGVKRDALRWLDFLRGVDPDGQLDTLRALLG